jgi:serine/threonine protein kinase
MSNNNNEQKENSTNDTKQVSKSEDKDFDEDYIYQNTEKIDDYIVLKELGRGSFGLVYLVQNEISKKSMH